MSDVTMSDLPFTQSINGKNYYLDVFITDLCCPFAVLSNNIKLIIMNRLILQQRTKQFHIDVIKFCEDFPRNAAGFEIAKQLIRSAGSVGANYRATVRAKSTADFINKVAIVLEEADESHYWLEITRDSDLKKGTEADRLVNEAFELTAIFAATNKTAKKKRGNNKL